ncbi:hypothetical protein [Gracilibacillus sp. YIM 98692]|uniref:hypothetical protein n=1 Tax=Gracilibacillus sp. YIM 98692 TaxID=2663532 RepID=UPI0013D2F848|nr:hypothetical protein [Gracilibacillus sp. YIM 98692]
MSDYPFFYAIKPRKFHFDTYYKIFITETDFRGAKIAGQLMDEESVEVHFNFRGLLGVALSIVLERWAYKFVKLRYKTEKWYDEKIDIMDGKFLSVDKANFSYLPETIESVKIKRKSNFHTGFVNNSGVIEFYINDGSREKYIIYPIQDMDEIKENIAALIMNIEVE